MMHPKYLTQDHQTIRLETGNNHTVIAEPRTHPDLFQRALDGEFGGIAPYEPSEGDGPEQPDVVVSRLQAKLALHQMGLLDQTETLVGMLDRATLIAWTEATTFRRSSPLLIGLAPALTWPDGQPLSDTDLDDLFALASTIEV